jgi:hypothetical protein
MRVEGSGVQRFQGFRGSRGSEVQGFKGSGVQRFKVPFSSLDCISFVGFRSSTQPTIQPFLFYQRNPTRWPKIEPSPTFLIILPEILLKFSF